MRKDIVIGLGAALATFAVTTAEASASCNWDRRACRNFRPPPVYNYLPPPPAHGYAPTVKIYVVPPAYAPPAASYYNPPAYPNGGRPYSYGASYYGLPAYNGNGYYGNGYYRNSYNGTGYNGNGYYGNGYYRNGYNGTGYNGNGYYGNGYYGYAPPAYYDGYRPAGVWIQIR